MTSPQGGDVVVDTSAVIEAVCAAQPDPALMERLATADRRFVPHLVDIEVISVVRRLVQRQALTGPRAELALSLFAELPLSRVSHEPLRARIWSLRGNVSPYDAAFVALAEAFEAPLLTCDARLSRASGPTCRFEVVGAGADAG